MSSMYEFKGYAMKNMKVKITSMNYEYNEDNTQVKCILTIGYDSNNQYGPLALFAESYLGMQVAVTPRYPLTEEFSDDINKAPVKTADGYIYLPESYKYIGVANLKDGDESDIVLAKRIAYKKAYRQAMKFYMSCYMNLHRRTLSYLNDVCLPQIMDLNKRYDEVCSDIKAIVRD